MRRKKPNAAAPDLSALLRRRLPAPDLALLRAAGRLADRAGVGLYLVGGAVRDLLCAPRRSPGAAPDLDLVVDGDGPDFARRLAGHWGGEVVVHARFLTATVRRRDGKRVDVAGARRETYPRPAALPVVAAGTLEDDARRRDFSVNAMAVRLNPGDFGRLHDPCNGRADLARGVLRILHPRSFHDDPTRILRAARYAARCGLHLEAATARALRAEVSAGGLKRLSPARLWHEWVRLLTEPDPAPVMLRLRTLGVLARLHPRLARGLWSRARWADLEAGRLLLPDPPDVLVMRTLAWWDPLDRAQTRALGKRLGLPDRLSFDLDRCLKTEGEQVRSILLRSDRLTPVQGVALFGRLPPEVLWVLRAKLPRRHLGRTWIGAYLRKWRYVRPLLTGKDLGRLGYPMGPEFTVMLEALRDERLAGRARTRADEVRFLRRTFPVPPRPVP
jgi:tRNA nucleotidyltransferase (CCA-adding enzyme)